MQNPLIKATQAMTFLGKSWGLDLLNGNHRWILTGYCFKTGKSTTAGQGIKRV